MESKFDIKQFPLLVDNMHGSKLIRGRLGTANILIGKKSHVVCLHLYTYMTKIFYQNGFTIHVTFYACIYFDLLLNRNN